MELAPRRPRLEVADIFRAHGASFLEKHAATLEQRRVLRHLSECRTAALGGHVDACDSCGHSRISYNSCRDRHCPKCQTLKQAEWLAKRRERLLPCPYFHVVFTLPDLLNALILRNRARLFDLLFDTAAATLDTVARDPRRLGARIGFTAVLHTWGQNLQFHPHLHCVVTGGGVALDGSRWVATTQDFLFPVRVLGRLFRGKLLAGLKALHDAGQLDLGGGQHELANPRAFQRLVDRLYDVDWVVYSKPPFGGPGQVFQYLGRYTHRVAIGNHRLLEATGEQVAFRYRDSRDESRLKVLRVKPHEFIRRFLLHVLPQRFVKIRHFGILAGRNVATQLEHARALLAKDDPAPRSASAPTSSAPVDADSPWHERLLALTGVDVFACPACPGGRLVRTHAIAPEPARTSSIPALDSS